MTERVSVYIDGFNMYHALDDLQQQHLKWVNLYKLSELLTKPRTQQLVAVNYFSAFAAHFQNSRHEQKLRRHRAYVRALEAKGVNCRMGNFAKRDWMYYGRNYRARWRRREEKQTDVAIGVQLVRDAFCNEYDRALIISCDADMIPAFRMAKTEFPAKRFVTVSPPKRAHHRSLLSLADDSISIKVSQVEKALFGSRVSKNGQVVAYRPAAYRP